MKTTVEFLDAVKNRYHLPSDYALANKLGITRSGVSKFRLGKDKLGDQTALKIAELLEIEPGYVLACIAAERSKDERVKKAWAWWADHKSLAAVLAVLAVLPFAPWIDQDSLSGIARLGLTSSEAGTLYIMSNLLAWYWPLLILLATLAWLAFPRSRRHNPPP